MTIEQIQEAFPHTEVRENDRGKYAEIWFGNGVFVSIHPSDQNEVMLSLSNNLRTLKGVKSIDDLKKLEELFNGSEK